jgi:hypothetical protein
MKYNKKPISDILRSPKTVLTFKDISLIWKNNSKKAVVDGISYYIKTGQLFRIRRGIYAKDKNYDKLELATRIFTPSYVSFETVLVQAGFIFQFYQEIKIASYQTRELEIYDQKYSYRKIKDIILTNSAGIEHRGETSIASPERAFLDTMYIYKNYYFDNLNSLNWEKVFELLPIYQNKKMEKKVKELFKDNNLNSIK